LTKPGDRRTDVVKRSALSFEYRAIGASASGLDKLAAGVNSVLMQQLDRLRRYAETGKADAARP
jgi:hypothetical protein